MTVAGERPPLRAVALYTADPWDSALPVLRVRGPAEAMGITVVRGNEGDAVAPERVSMADLVIVQRDFPRFEGAWQAVTARAWAEGKPVIYEMDDLLLDVPEGHAMERAYSDVLFSVLRAVVEADAVVASTNPLCNYLAPFNPQVHLYPNCLDDRLWPMPDQVPQADPASPIVIGYMGGQTHLPDLLDITPSLLNVLERFGERIRYWFWGVQPPAALLDRPNVTWTPLNLLSYADFARYFSGQACDIFVAPLQDNTFNRCKSGIKYLEYSALGVAGVYSRLEPYDMIVRSGENGLLASTQAEWEESLGQLIESAGLRQTLAAGARATVRRDWLLSSRAPDWLRLYQGLAQAGPRSVLLAPHRQALARVAQQVQGRQHELEERLRTLGRQVEVQSLEVSRLNHELSEIHNSPAWQLALKIRGLRFRLAPRGSWRERLLDNLTGARRRNSPSDKGTPDVSNAG